MINSDSKINPADLAREALKHYFEKGSLPKFSQSLPPDYNIRAGAFVTLKKGSQLRGCIGTVQAVEENLAKEISANAVSAAVRDPRFTPVRSDELDELSISVDILSPMERIESESDLDPKKYGVLMRSGSRSGLLLPDLESVNSVEEQLTIVRQKAGIARGEPVELYRFTVSRYGEK